jgi:hypothetical protein
VAYSLLKLGSLEKTVIASLFHSGLHSDTIVLWEKRFHISDAASGWAGWALAYPEFGSSVHPIPITSHCCFLTRIWKPSGISILGNDMLWGFLKKNIQNLFWCQIDFLIICKFFCSKLFLIRCQTKDLLKKVHVSLGPKMEESRLWGF